MSTWYRSIAVFLSVFMFFMQPLAVYASEVTRSTINISITSQIPSDFLFTQDMYNGLDSEQVRMLQIFLNGDPQTLVKSTGPGSPGNETTYFGNATQSAVERFQTIYKSVILEPLGFSSPTGIIGARSRSVLNQILDNLRKNLPANTSIYTGRVVQNSGSNSLSVATSTTSSTTSHALLKIETTSIPSATVGSAYAAVIQATGGADTYNWSVLYGSLPNGIVAKSSDCTASPCKSALIISGTPNSAGSFTFIVRLESGNQYVTKELVINIQDRAQTTTTQNTTTGTSISISNTTPSIDTSSSTASSSSSNLGLALGVLGAGVAIGAVSSAVSSASSAAMPSFGGRIVFVQYCTCTAFILLYVLDTRKVVLPLLYIPGYSKLLMNYNIWYPGPQVLGGYTYGGPPCLVYAGTACVTVGQPVGIIDAIRGVGSSL
jgi:peptidoglycan hydrolase-like protein with peptidoglycan-binding domain